MGEVLYKMTVFKEMYTKATAELAAASEARTKAVEGLLTDLLAEKGLGVGQSCKIELGKGAKLKELVGVFSITPLHDDAILKFVPYKKDGTLSKIVRIFDFGTAPDFSWDTARITSATICETVTE